MSRSEDWAWAAGLFEGEGSCVVPNKTGKQRIRFQLKMNDKDVLLHFLSITGGTLRGPYQYQYKDGHYRQQHYLWQSDGQSTRYIYDNMKPYLFARRRARIDELLQLYGHALDEVGHLQLEPRDLTKD